MDKAKLVQKATAARRESRQVDFKDRFDTASTGSWCEVVKDIVAMANSGGGVLVFGVSDNGMQSAEDPRHILAVDPAVITDKIAKYTGRQFGEHEMVEIHRSDHVAVALVVSDVDTPMVFEKAGTYKTPAGEEKVGFQKGTVYFRHGAKSEPGTGDDIKEAMERRIERVRKGWLSGIKKVTEAPPGHTVQVLPAEIASRVANGSLRARIVADEDAPRVRVEAAEKTWPHRTKELVSRCNDRLGDRAKLNAHDIVCVKKMCGVNENEHPEFVYKPFKHFAPQYSEQFVEWIVARYEADPALFLKARAQYKAQTV